MTPKYMQQNVVLLNEAESGFTSRVKLSRSYHFSLKTGTDNAPEIQCCMYRLFLIDLNLKKTQTVEKFHETNNPTPNPSQ